MTAPAGQTTLGSFTFYLHVEPALIFRAYVYAWNGSEATGPALYEGPNMHTANESVFEPITADTGGVAVTPGQQYVLFFSIANNKAEDENLATFNYQDSWGAVYDPSAYTEGSFKFINNGYETSDWTTVGWNEFNNPNLAFTAVFSGAPALVCRR